MKGILVSVLCVSVLSGLAQAQYSENLDNVLTRIKDGKGISAKSLLLVMPKNSPDASVFYGQIIVIQPVIHLERLANLFFSNQRRGIPK